MAAYPGYGKLLADGYEEDPQTAVIRTPMEAGPHKQAKVRSLQTVIRDVTYLYTAAEYITWKVFFNTTINRGVDWFDWTDPVDSVVKQARIVGGQHSRSPHRGTLAHWYISFQLETVE